MDDHTPCICDSPDSPHALDIPAHQILFFDMFSVFDICLLRVPRCKRRKAKSFPESVPDSPQPTLPTLRTDSLPPPTTLMPSNLTTSRIPAVAVDESDMHDVLSAIFGRAGYEVALDRDIYRVTAPRKLTRVSGKSPTPCC